MRAALPVAASVSPPKACSKWADLSCPLDEEEAVARSAVHPRDAVHNAVVVDRGRTYWARRDLHAIQGGIDQTGSRILGLLVQRDLHRLLGAISVEVDAVPMRLHAPQHDLMRVVAEGLPQLSHRINARHVNKLALGQEQLEVDRTTVVIG